jgi:hypothetical protein
LKRTPPSNLASCVSTFLSEVCLPPAARVCRCKLLAAVICMANCGKGQVQVNAIKSASTCPRPSAARQVARFDATKRSLKQALPSDAAILSRALTHRKFNAPCKDRNKPDRTKTGLKCPEVPQCRWHVDRLTALCRQAPVKTWREKILASFDGALGIHRGLRRDPARAGLDAVDREAKAATPVNRRQGKDVIIAGSVSDVDAKTILPASWKAPKPYLRITTQPD